MDIVNAVTAWLIIIYKVLDMYIQAKRTITREADRTAESRRLSSDAEFLNGKFRWNELYKFTKI
jgi:hypothetical protein